MLDSIFDIDVRDSMFESKFELNSSLVTVRLSVRLSSLTTVTVSRLIPYPVYRCKIPPGF